MSKGSNIMVNIDDLEMALDFNSSGPYSDNYAYLDTETGQIYYVSDIIDEEPPEDIDENEKYMLLPTKQELELGKSLAIKFANETDANLSNQVYSIFSSKGAYSRFKSLLESKGLLEQWYKYEQDKTREAVKDWCIANEIQCN
jgi:hypothetical protein